MLLKCIVLFLVIVAVQSATLQGRNIPVEIRYERLDHDITSNLAEKVQLSADDLKENQLRLEKLHVAEENLLVPETDHSNLIKNLDEKVQLSPEELLQSPKHIPIHYSLKEDPEHDDLRLDILGERFEQLPATSSDEASSKASLIQQAQDIIQKGLQHLKNNFTPKGDEIAPPKELWDKLEKDVEEYFLEQKNKLATRQNQATDQQNIFQNFANGFQQLTNNFIQQFQGQNQTNQPAASGDEGTAGAGTTQQQGPIQGFIGYFTGGVQNIVSNIQNLGQNGQQVVGNSTVLGDSGTGGTGQAPTNIIGSFVNGVQQLFQGPQQGINQILSGNNTQGDTGNPTGTQQQGFFAGAISQINQVVSNIIPTPSPQTPPVVQGDEGTGTTGTTGTTGATGVNQGGPVQQVFQQIGNIGSAFTQFIQGGPQNKPQGTEDENAGQAPNQNFIQSIGQNIGNAFQNIQNQFRPPGTGTPQKPAAGGETPSSNPIVGQVSNVGNQLQQAVGQVAGNNPVQNLIPGSSSGTPVKAPAGEQSSAAAVAEEAPEPKPEEVEKKEVMTATE